MPRKSTRIRLAATLLCALGVTATLVLPGSKPEAVAQPKPTLRYSGAAACSGCHNNPQAGVYPTDFCLLNESQIWREQDKHSQAFEVLKTERSKQMGEILGVDVTTAKECISCHAVVATKQQQGRNFSLEDGVSCDACHGPSGLWVVEHWNNPDWRTLSAAEKAEFGMKDVRDPVGRAKMCLSCHVGNTEEGKVVTHEMYAAGHPPLPGFEIETFVNEEPKHWRYLGEKPKEIQELFKYDAAVQHRTQLVVLGGLTALREAVQLFGSEAQRLQGQWPDIAQFDCYACHHDLAKPQTSWRLARGFESWRLLEGSTVPPGRPQIREWTSVLAVLALMQAGQTEAQIAEALKPLHEALSQQPYGAHQAVSEAATKVVTWLDEQVAAINSRTLDQAAGENLLKLITQIGAADDHVLDFDSARQLAWAFRIILTEVRGEPSAPLQATLAKLDTQLRSQLPSGHKESILENLRENLTAVSDYDPKVVKATFVQLGKQLEGG